MTPEKTAAANADGANKVALAERARHEKTCTKCAAIRAGRHEGGPCARFWELMLTLERTSEALDRALRRCVG